MRPSLSLQEECVMQQAVPSESPRSSVVNKCTVRPESSIGSTSATYVPSRIADLNKWLGSGNHVLTTVEQESGKWEGRSR